MTDPSLDILVVDDEPGLREVLAVRLSAWGHRVRTAGDVEEADLAVATRRPDVVLSDVVLPGLSGLDLLHRIQRADLSLPVILMTAHGQVDKAVDAMKAGALDFLTKPLDSAALRALLDAVVAERRDRSVTSALEDSLQAGDAATGLIGDSAAMRAVRSLVQQVAVSDATVLITGESGTGKEVVARAIHQASPRHAEAFVAINAAAIPEGLIESEIFGHEVGAFTGAARARAGCFELSDRGTLFLDEIAEMPLLLQPKLLRVLEDGRVRRLGGIAEADVDVRIVSATNRPPLSAIADGRLREDLYYRLNIFELALPPLRERRDDIPLLAQYFVRRFNRKHGVQAQGLRPPSLERLAGWHWPGNVRELRNVMERAIVLARDGWIEPTHLPPHIRNPAPHHDPRPIELPSQVTLAEAERLLVLGALERTGHNKAAAARQLGMDVKTIRNKLKAWGVSS